MPASTLAVLSVVQDQLALRRWTTSVVGHDRVIVGVDSIVGVLSVDARGAALPRET